MHDKAPGAERRSTAPPSNAYDHVVFDLDGTLADTREDLVGSVNHVLGTLGLPVLPFETVCEYIGEGARRLVQRSLGSAHADLVDEALARFMDYYGAHVLDRTTPYPGVTEVVTVLRGRGLTLSVLTNKPERLSRAILDGLGLSSSFCAIVGGDSLPVRKPDPGGIEHLLTLSSTPRARMLMVGDSAIDMETARAAAVAFCGVTWGIRPWELTAVPETSHLIERPEELLAVVSA